MDRQNGPVLHRHRQSSLGEGGMGIVFRALDTKLLVVRRPAFENLADVRFVEWNHEIQTFSACAADQTFTESIGSHRQLHRLIRVRRNISVY